MKFLQRINFITKFYKGSKRYFFSAIGFPPKIRQEVSAVYNFCRAVDDTIDEPNKIEYTFDEIRADYQLGIKTGCSKIPIVNEFVRIKKTKGIKDEWVEALFESMLMDKNEKIYENLEDTLNYTYGVAEVIGLFMCRVLDLPNEAHRTARYLGRSAQWINFIRDIHEDLELGRQYFPKSDLNMFNLKNLKYETVLKQPDEYKAFMSLQFERFEKWVEIGEEGYKFIPRKYKRPIKYATQLDKWKLQQIRKNPYIIYSKKVDPGILEFLSSLFKLNMSNKPSLKIFMRKNSV